MTMLSVENLHVGYRSGGATLRAVDGVSFTAETGETVALVGESGCGKSSLGRAVLHLTKPSAGRVIFAGNDPAVMNPTGLKQFRSRAQMIFQDPLASLNPRHTIGEILGTPLAVHGMRDRGRRQEAVATIIAKVGLAPDAPSRYPHEFSGGQRQRIGIARALILRPELVVCDEPVSALDLSVQAQILNLLVAMKREFSLSYLFISHDLSVVRYFADRILVMYLGRIVESAATTDLWAAPRHPYTRTLMDAVPEPTRRRTAPAAIGEMPSARALPAGCRFNPRCPIATQICREQDPPLRASADGHAVACHHATS